MTRSLMKKRSGNLEWTDMEISRENPRTQSQRENIPQQQLTGRQLEVYFPNTRDKEPSVPGTSQIVQGLASDQPRR